ncbi:hypothetical protein F4859DRAFT_330285 [Xylaria cf. heliscus]|nr:hypothetical protein F4859DRAFT_330285 [Xylaria cf. heliscus]
MTSTSGESTPAFQAVKITQGGKELIPYAVPVLTGAFRNDPVFNYFMGALSEEERKDYLPLFLTGLLKASTLNKGIILEVSSWGCCAVLLPPGKKVDSPRTIFQAGLVPITLRLGPMGIKRILVEHSTAVKHAKKKAFTPKELSEYWYLFIIGTDPNRQRQGLGGILLEHMKAHAQSHGRPLWLEASNANARGLYAKHGFKEVEEFTLGLGLAGPDGLAQKGGEGVKSWGMVWRPTLKKVE